MDMQEFLDGLPEARTSLDRRLGSVRDLVRGVAGRYYPGLYLHGRPGTGKTHTVLEALAASGMPVVYRRGHLTSLGLFDLMEAHPGGLLVLDDLGEIFKYPIALQILLAALGQAPRGWRGPRGSRPVSYRRKDDERVIDFSGGVIAISNAELHDRDLLEAFKSRADAINYDPTDREVAALLLDIAAQGFGHEQGSLRPEECREVALFYIEEALRRGVRLDLRVFCDKSRAKFLQHRNGDAATHWKDLVRLSIEERLAELEHTPLPGPGPGVRRLAKGREHELVRRLLAERPDDRDGQIAEWTRRTAKSARAFYRRLGEVEADGRTCH